MLAIRLFLLLLLFCCGLNLFGFHAMDTIFSRCGNVCSLLYFCSESCADEPLQNSDFSVDRLFAEQDVFVDFCVNFV